MSVTIRDVARAAGVSPKTVSRVINNEPRVLATTRQKVLATVRDLGFHPNPLARGLATKLTRNLGLIGPDLSNPFFARGIDGCVAVAEQFGYNVFLGTGSDSRRQARHVRALLGQHVSGLIIWVGSISDAALAQLMEEVAHRCPVVFIDRPADPDTANLYTHHAVLIDQHYIGELATHHLLSEGRRSLAYLGTGPRAGGWVGAQRLAGFCDVLRGEGIEPHTRWLRHIYAATIREGVIGASTLLAQRPHPDGIVAYNDLLAIGALQACRREGLRVPDDVAIIGVDDTEMAAVTDPPLSTIRQHQYELGAHAVALLLTLLDASSTAAAEALVRNSLPIPDLVVRRSSSLRAPSVASPEEIEGLP